MVWANERLRVSVALLTKLGAAMGAAILHGMYCAVPIAHDDDVALADASALEVSGVRNLDLERRVTPVSAIEQAFEFSLVDFRIGVDAIRHPRGLVRRPVETRCQAFRREHRRAPLCIAE